MTWFLTELSARTCLTTIVSSTTTLGSSSQITPWQRCLPADSQHSPSTIYPGEAHLWQTGKTPGRWPASRA